MPDGKPRLRDLTLEWCRLFCERPVVLRAIRFAIVVGAVLIAINHGDAILRGDVDRSRLLKMGLTVLVPYVVSALSSVGAMRQLDRRSVGAAASSDD